MIKIKITEFPVYVKKMVRLPNGKKLASSTLEDTKKLCPIDFDFRNRKIIKRPRECREPRYSIK